MVSVLLKLVVASWGPGWAKRTGQHGKRDRQPGTRRGAGGQEAGGLQGPPRRGPADAWRPSVDALGASGAPSALPSLFIPVRLACELWLQLSKTAQDWYRLPS